MYTVRLLLDADDVLGSPFSLHVQSQAEHLESIARDISKVMLSSERSVVDFLSKLDHNHDGYVGMSELHEALVAHGIRYTITNMPTNMP